MFQALITQNRELQDTILNLQRMVGELRIQNIQLEEQIKLAVALSKSTSPIYNDEVRKESLMEAVQLENTIKARETSALDVNIIK